MVDDGAIGSSALSTPRLKDESDIQQTSFDNRPVYERLLIELRAVFANVISNAYFFKEFENRSVCVDYFFFICFHVFHQD
jgi:hypothetical protein